MQVPVLVNICLGSSNSLYYRTVFLFVFGHEFSGVSGTCGRSSFYRDRVGDCTGQPGCITPTLQVGDTIHSEGLSLDIHQQKKWFASHGLFGPDQSHAKCLSSAETIHDMQVILQSGCNRTSNSLLLVLVFTLSRHPISSLANVPLICSQILYVYTYTSIYQALPFLKLKILSMKKRKRAGSINNKLINVLGKNKLTSLASKCG